MRPKGLVEVAEVATYPELRVMATVPGGGVRMRGLPFSSSASAFFFDLKRPSFFDLALPIDDTPNDDGRWWPLSIRMGKGGPVSLKKSRKARVSSRVILVTASRL